MYTNLKTYYIAQLYLTHPLIPKLQMNALLETYNVYMPVNKYGQDYNVQVTVNIGITENSTVKYSSVFESDYLGVNHGDFDLKNIQRLFTSDYYGLDQGEFDIRPIYPIF